MASYRALFISDVHLGIRSAKDKELLDFLRENDAGTIYLVGDIVDFWAIRRSAFWWPQSHNDVVQKLLRKVRKGARLVYIPGNHDEDLKDYHGTRFGGIEVEPEAVHVTASGRRYLVIHGDQFDFVVRRMPWLAHFGARCYGVALWLNRPFNFVRRRFGLEYWSLSSFLKVRVKSAVNKAVNLEFSGSFEKLLSEEARARGLDGVICGHIHRAASLDLDGIHYVNSGDWVENCTAIAETEAGDLVLIRWLDGKRAEKSQAAAPVLEAA